MGWRGVFFCLGAAMTALGLAFACRGRGGRFRGQVPSLANIKAILVLPAFWALMLLFSLGIGGSMGVFTMLPLFLVESRGMEMSSANFLVSLSRASGLGAAFLAGWLVDRVGFKRTLLMVFAASGLLTALIGLGQGPWLWLALFLQPGLMVCFFPAGFAALAGLGDESARSLAVGLTVPMSFVLGGGGFPAAIGWAAQVYSLSWGFVGAGALILCGVILLPWLDSGARS
jgi:NNP family nitrate/nitrite transporter-like MFS transporter